LPPPALVVIVVDASNLQRNLYFATQVIELGHPTIIALNMMDVAETNGARIDDAGVSARLGVPVVSVVASLGRGIHELREAIIASLRRADPPASRACFCELAPALATEVEKLAHNLPHSEPGHEHHAAAEALLLLTSERALVNDAAYYPEPIRQQVVAARQRLETAGIDWQGAAIEGRYARLARIQAGVTTQTHILAETVSDRIDRVVTHKLWGTLIFIGLMALIFQSIFTFAQWPMDAIKTAVGWLGKGVAASMVPGDLRSLLVSGVVKGVGAVVVFLPQILLLFFFIGLLEDTGYMARAAFLMDRLMSKVGLHGKSFIPMLSSFACAIPGIMATRTIESPKDRLVTILVAPLMSCSARLPVYTILILACIPNQTVLGFLKLSALTMLGMYLLGIVVALLMAWLFKKTLLKGETPMLIMELPPYKMPVAKVVLRHMWERSKLFLRRAGTVILGINILLWFLATHPRYEMGALNQQRAEVIHEVLPETKNAEAKIEELRARFAGRSSSETNAEAAAWRRVEQIENQMQAERLRDSYAGRMGRLLEPVIAPLGFDWKMGIGIIASFAAREVFVSTMATVYSLGEADDSAESTNVLAERLKEQKRADGSPLYTALTGITLMVFYVFALQCVSTVAVVRRETNSWKWPLFQWAYMGALAWGLAFLTYHAGRLLGWG
jgi:ferrous iron transport protein B